jgi:hypothetical protein
MHIIPLWWVQAEQSIGYVRGRYTYKHIIATHLLFYVTTCGLQYHQVNIHKNSSLSCPLKWIISITPQRIPLKFLTWHYLHQTVTHEYTIYTHRTTSTDPGTTFGLFPVTVNLEAKEPSMEKTAALVWRRTTAIQHSAIEPSPLKVKMVWWFYILDKTYIQKPYFCKMTLYQVIV